jgi:hypothetical protein
MSTEKKTITGRPWVSNAEIYKAGRELFPDDDEKLKIWIAAIRWIYLEVQKRKVKI